MVKNSSKNYLSRHIHWLGLSAAWRDSLPQFTRPKNPDQGRCGGSTWKRWRFMLLFFLDGRMELGNRAKWSERKTRSTCGCSPQFHCKQIFRKITFHLTFNRKFRIFWLFKWNSLSHHRRPAIRTKGYSDIAQCTLCTFCILSDLFYLQKLREN